jgi:serine/threonine-protein kinase
VDGRADQFALAVIAYEILTGEKPFVGEYLPTLLYKIVREDPISPQRLNPSLGAHVESVLRRALAKNPEERYENCTVFVADLAAACAANPGWQPQARGASQTLPTLGGARVAGRRTAQRQPLVLPPSRPPRHDEPRNPLVKSLIWMLVGIGLVGLVLLGAQRYLFNRSIEEPQAATVPPVSSPAPAPAPAPADTARAPADTAPKPSPMGEVPKPDAAPRAEIKSKATTRSTQPAIETPPPSRASDPEDEPPSRSARPAPPPKSLQVAPAPRSSPGAEHTVQFLTEPPGAQVVVDSNSALACRTPCMLTMSAGRHVVSTRMEGFREYPRVINVPQDSDIFLQLSKSSATLSITSNPPGAAIALNGVEQKNRTPLLLNVAPGTYRVRVTRDGVPFEFDVTIRDGEFINKNVKF